jgi:hypothetical protein
MPNWCSNSLYVSGDSDKVKEFKNWVITEVSVTEIVRDEQYNAVLGENGEPLTKEVMRERFTFEKLFPTPLELLADVDPIPHKEGEDEEAYEARLEQLKEKYGHSGWYNWRVSNWGTKWDACESDWDLEDDGMTIHFQTAWAPPIGWLENVSAQFPELVFKMTFQEEGCGFCGRADGVDGMVEWQDGEVVLEDEDGLAVEWDSELDRYKYVDSGVVIDDEDFWPIEHNPFA